jgi:hypothetical protein
VAVAVHPEEDFLAQILDRVMVPDHRAQLPMDPVAMAVIQDAQRFGIIPDCTKHQFGFRIGDESGRNHGRMTSE